MSASGTTICPRCGERLPEGFTRCDACGAYLVPQPTEPASAGTKRGAVSSRKAPARSGAPRWVYLIVGLLIGGVVGYALHSAVGPRSEGGAPTGPADILSGGSAPEGGMGAAPGGTPRQMPPAVLAEIRKYQSALMMDPNDLQANIGMGNLEFDSQHWDRAIQYYSKALEKDPTNADVRVDRAIAYHGAGQDEKAKSEMVRVTKEHPEHRNAWLNLGVVSAGTGDKATAVRAWEQYLKLDPNGEHAAAIRAELEELKKSP